MVPDNNALFWLLKSRIVIEAEFNMATRADVKITPSLITVGRFFTL